MEAQNRTDNKVQWDFLLNRLLSYVRRFQSPNADGEEAVSQTLLELLVFLQNNRLIFRNDGLSDDQKGEQFNTACTQLAYSILKRRVIDKHRAQSRVREVPLEAAGDIISPGQNPEERYLMREATGNAEKILAQLSFRDEEVIRSYFLEELDHREICKSLNVGDTYLRVLKHRALRSFREKMKCLEYKQ